MKSTDLIKGHVYQFNGRGAHYGIWIGQLNNNHGMLICRKELGTYDLNIEIGYPYTEWIAQDLGPCPVPGPYEYGNVAVRNYLTVLEDNYEIR